MADEKCKWCGKGIRQILPELWEHVESGKVCCAPQLLERSPVAEPVAAAGGQELDCDCPCDICAIGTEKHCGEPPCDVPKADTVLSTRPCDWPFEGCCDQKEACLKANRCLKNLPELSGVKLACQFTCTEFHVDPRCSFHRAPEPSAPKVEPWYYDSDGVPTPDYREPEPVAGTASAPQEPIVSGSRVLGCECGDTFFKSPYQHCGKCGRVLSTAQLPTSTMQQSAAPSVAGTPAVARCPVCQSTDLTLYSAPDGIRVHCSDDQTHPAYVLSSVADAAQFFPAQPLRTPPAPEWPLNLFCEMHTDTTLADANVSDPCPLCAAEERANEVVPPESATREIARELVAWQMATGKFLTVNRGERAPVIPQHELERELERHLHSAAQPSQDRAKLAEILNQPARLFYAEQYGDAPLDPETVSFAAKFAACRLTGYKTEEEERNAKG